MSLLIDWKNVCLVCLKKSENRSIFERDADSKVIADKIMKCADIFIEKNANQPKSICLQCHDNLNVTCKFHRNYNQSDSIIKALSTTHKEFQIKDLWKTNSVSGAQEKQSPQNEIFHIEESANSNEIDIKHEIMENDVVDYTCDNDNSPCIDVRRNIDTGDKFVPKDPTEACFQGSDIEQNDVKANEGNKIKEDANDEIPTRLRSESKTSIENSCDKQSPKSVYKKALKICEICNLGFKHQSNLTIHMRRHNNERPFSCDHCDKAYVRSAELQVHMRAHTGEKPYKCQYCDSRFAQMSNRKRHERTHAGERPFVCPTCGKAFPDSNALEEHRQIHTAVKKFMCEVCGKAFDKRLLLERHVAHHLSRDKLDKSSEHKQKKVLEKEIFQIEECAKSNEINIKHEIIESNLVDDTHDNDNSPCIDLRDNIDSEAKFAPKDPAEAYYECSAIEQIDVKANEGNKIKRDANAEIPTRLTSESKTSIENSCDRQSPKSVYKKALKICEICNRGFKYQWSLTIHMRRHNNERPFSCDRCDKAYVRSAELRVHMRAHTGEKPYKCQYCDRRFTLKWNQKDHERTHTGERPYQCQYCDRRFTHKGNRKRHERTHTGERPFVCPTCGKSFTYSHGLVEHRQIHTAVKKFVCEECGKAFDKRLFLERHVVLHLNLDKLGMSSEHKPKKVLEKEIFQIEECAKSNEINIKHEIIETDVDDTHDTENSLCIGLEDNINSEVKFALKDPTEACFQGGAIQQNDVTADESNTIKQDANDEIPTRPRSESKTSIENSCDKQSPKSVYEKALKICEICNRGFKYQSTFSIHMRRHNNERPFSCHRCGKAYVWSAALRRHMTTHTGEKPYKCQYCDRRFAENNNRKIHERTHTGEKPYQCQYCDRRFTQKCHVEKHERTHTGEKPYQCQYCDRGFTQKCSQEKHERTHTC